MNRAMPMRHQPRMPQQSHHSQMSQSAIPRPHQGMALIEALMASAVLGIGLIGAMQLTLKTLYVASENRQHTAAQQLAQEGMDCLLANASPCPVEDLITLQGVRYTRQTHVTPRGTDPINDVKVIVEWLPIGGGLSSAAAPVAVRRITWHSSVSTLPHWVGTPTPSSLLP